MLIQALFVTLIVTQVLFFIVVVLAFLSVIVCTTSIIMGVPFVRTPSRLYDQIERALSINPGDTMYELGSGDGGLSLSFSQRFPEARFIGVERNPLLFAYAQTKKRFLGNPSNLSFRRESFFDTDLKDATKIYAYLSGSIMDMLLPKLERECSCTKLASRAFEFKKKAHADARRIAKKDGFHGQHMLYMYEF